MNKRNNGTKKHQNRHNPITPPYFAIAVYHYQICNKIYRRKQNDNSKYKGKSIKEGFWHRGKYNTKNKTANTDNRECRHTLLNNIAISIHEGDTISNLFPYLLHMLTLNVIRYTGNDSCHKEYCTKTYGHPCNHILTIFHDKYSCKNNQGRC